MEIDHPQRNCNWTGKPTVNSILKIAESDVGTGSISQSFSNSIIPEPSALEKNLQKSRVPNPTPQSIEKTGNSQPEPKDLPEGSLQLSGKDDVHMESKENLTQLPSVNQSNSALGNSTLGSLTSQNRAGVCETKHDAAKPPNR